MYIVPPLWPHTYDYIGEVTILTGFMTRRVKTHIRLGIRSVSPSDKSPSCPHEETFGP